MSTGYLQNTESVTSEVFNEDTVVINFLTGTYFSLRGLAPHVWALLQTPTSLEEILASVGGETPDARASIQEMLDVLIGEDCVRSVDVVPTDSGSPRSQVMVPYTPPVVEVFHDLQELIVVDPVHEVDETDGWPHRPPPFRLE